MDNTITVYINDLIIDGKERKGINIILPEDVTDDTIETIERQIVDFLKTIL